MGAKKKIKIEESKFGRGLCYCLGLFLCHSERGITKTYEDWPHMWFNAASDHLYEIDPSTLPKRLRERVSEFKDKCLSWGHGFGLDKSPYGEPTAKSVEWAIQEAKDLLREIDSHNGVQTVQGIWE